MKKIQPRLLIEMLLFLIFWHLVFIRFELYFYTPWLDMPMHFFGGLLSGLVGICIVSARTSMPENVSGRSIVIASIFTALLIGGLWEIIEFNSNTIFGFELVKIENVEDTKSDLLFDLLGALSGAVYFLFIKKDT